MEGGFTLNYTTELEKVHYDIGEREALFSSTTRALRERNLCSVPSMALWPSR